MSAGEQPPAAAAGRSGHAASLRLGEWLVFPGSNEMSRDGATTRVESKAMEVLVVLAEHPGEVVGREQLLDAVWAGTSVGDDTLTQAVIKLRKALGDDTRRPAYIETIPKRGYRLIAPVDRSRADPLAPPAAGTAPSAAVGTTPVRRWVVAVAAMLAVGGALWWLGTGGGGLRFADTTVSTGSPARLAVLPFENLGQDPSHDYFNNGITADLITDLSKIPGIQVIAHSSSAGYRDADIPFPDIARELGVQYLLSGHVQKEGERVRINVGLIDASRNRYLWAERYDRELTSLFELQDEIRGKIVASLAVSLPGRGEGGAGPRYAASIEAYDLFLRGMDHMGRRELEDVRTAQEFFRQALAVDPGFGRAYAGLAAAHARDAIDGWAGDALASLEEAGRLADKAQSLDAGLPQVHFVQALVQLFRGEHNAAARAAQRAIALQPSYADAYAVLAWILHFSGQHDLALEPLAQAMHLNPRTPAAYLLTQGEILLSVGDLDKAIAALERAAQQSATHPRVLLILTAAYALAGRAGDAEWTLGQLRLVHPELSLARLRWALPFRDPTEAERLFDALRSAGVRDTVGS